MKILILSDSHGSVGVLKKIVEHEEPFDLLIHLGDGVEDVLRLKSIKNFNFDAIVGNSDPQDLFPQELVLNFHGYYFYFTHGHLYQVHNNLERLVSASKKAKATAAFYGHTHSFSDKVYKGVRFVNPGTVCSYLSNLPSYISMAVNPGELYLKKVLLNGE